MSTKRVAMMTQRAGRHLDAAARATDGFVRTPAALADSLVSGHRDIGTLPPGARVLEPSAGDGALVRAILSNDPDVHVVAVEPDNGRADTLDTITGEHPGRVTVYRGTLEQFAEYAASCRAPGMHDARHVAMGQPFDAVIMNPPFGDTTRAALWTEHIRVAWDLLTVGGVLVSVVPASYGYRADRVGREFRAWAGSQRCAYEKLDGQPFAESGTSTSAGVLTLTRPLPARPDGHPAWIYAPAGGVPVAVPGRPVTSATGALTLPVQEYNDYADGSRPRVVRFAGACYGCARPVWDHDDRNDAALWEASTIDAAEHGHTGPSVAMCLECGASNAAAHAAALRDVAPYWTPAPVDADGAGPVVYPLDLGAGTWATVRGVDARGWAFTLTGRVMCDPEPVADLGSDVSFRDRRIAVTLRTARGFDVELYALDDAHVTVRDVPGDVVPVAAGVPVPWGMPQPAHGRTPATRDVGTPGDEAPAPGVVVSPPASSAGDVDAGPVQLPIGDVWGPVLAAAGLS